MIKKAMQAIQCYQLLASGDTVLAALSGGADSIVLTSFLFSIKEQYGITLEAAHVNHGLRGEESDRDEAFVRAFCAQLHIPLHVLHVDVGAEAMRSGEGLEACGRRIRYAYFDSLAGDQGKIATAHTLSDNAETLLLHLVRGTGLRGAGGIAPKRGNVIRPLLHCSREEIEAFCTAHQLTYVVDSTNTDTAFARNDVRQNVIPALTALNPNFLASADRFMQTVRAEDAYLDSLAEQALKDVSLERDLDAAKAAALPEVLLRRVLRLYVQRQAGLTPEHHHVDVMQACLEEGKYGQICGGNRVRTYRGRFALLCSDGEKRDNYQYIDGNMNRMVLRYEDFINIEEKHKRQFAFCADYDKISGDVILRAREAGDRLVPAGRTVSKTLKQLFQETGVPKEQRAGMPVVCDGTGIVGVWGLCVSQAVSISKTTQHVLVITK